MTTGEEEVTSSDIKHENTSTQQQEEHQRPISPFGNGFDDGATV